MRHQPLTAEWERKDYSSLCLVMGFHNFTKVDMICQLCVSINDIGKTIKKILKEIFAAFLYVWGLFKGSFCLFNAYLVVFGLLLPKTKEKIPIINHLQKLL